MWFMILTTSSLTLEDTSGCSSVKVFTASTKYLPDVRWLGQQNVFCRNENVLQLGKCLERFSWNKALWSPSFFLMLFSFATMSLKLDSTLNSCISGASRWGYAASSWTGPRTSWRLWWCYADRRITGIVQDWMKWQENLPPLGMETFTYDIHTDGGGELKNLQV